MIDPLASYGTSVPSPILIARVRETAAYLAAPAAGWLTEEQRALALGIARRLTVAAAAQIDSNIDSAELWHDWMVSGIPSAQRLAGACFARAEEHRWRRNAVAGSNPAPSAGEDDQHEEMLAAAPGAFQSDTDRAYLALRIADRRRFDALGNPCIAIADLDPGLYRALLCDIVDWQAKRAGEDGELAARFAKAADVAADRQRPETGIDAAGDAYHRQLLAGAAVSTAGAAAIRRNDWAALVALLAAAQRRGYADMVLAIVTAEVDQLASMLVPIGVDHAELAPLEATLAMLPDRLITGAMLAEPGREGGQ